ncbi:CHAT domain-containing protein [Fulvivirgaceae bacterium BMA10]|uniref:CHAT domain-containing protein n=1 Tax=Splendidivirga corallicola TaxID=3051826 RepID=A0ABT8KKV9_9BACT|nr:CHAT domain-containing protein [Fulvivirgaceae bacterium BMA10]
MKRKCILLALLFILIFQNSLLSQDWKTLYDSSDVYWYRGQYLTSIYWLEKALPIAQNTFRKDKKDSTYLVTLYDLGLCYKYAGDFPKSEAYFKKVIQTVKRDLGGNNKDYALFLNGLADVYALQTKYYDAEQTRFQAINFEKRRDSTSLNYSVALRGLAKLYTNLGAYRKAEKYFFKSLEVLNKSNELNDLDLGSCLANIAKFYDDIGLFEKGIDYGIKAKDIFEALDPPSYSDYATVLNNLAAAYSHIKDNEKAEELNIKATNLRRKYLGENHILYGLSLHNLGSLYMSMGSYVNAEKKLLEALKIEKHSVGDRHIYYGRSLMKLAHLYKILGETKKANTLNRQGVEILKSNFGDQHPNFTTALLISINIEIALGNIDKADLIFSKLLENMTSQTDNYFPFLSETEKTKFYARIKRYFEIFNSFSVKRIDYNPSILQTVYDYQLQTKGILLNSVRKVRNTILNSEDSLTIRKYRSWEYHRNRLAKLHQSVRPNKDLLDSLENEANILEKELSAKSEDFAGVSNKKNYTWEDVRDRLQTGEAAIELIRFREYDFDSLAHFTDTIYYAALIVKPETRNQPELVLIKNGNDLENKYFENYRGAILDKQYEYESYEQYWIPLKQKLKGIKRVYLSPDGIYHQINLNTLSNGNTGKSLINETDIRIVTSTKDLLDPAIDKDLDKTAILFGNPGFEINLISRANIVKDQKLNHLKQYYSLDLERSEILEPLPGSQKEVELISSMLSDNGWKTEIFTKENALEESIKNIESPRVLHIATHGFFKENTNNKNKGMLEGNPLLNSGLMFSGAGYSIKNASSDSLLNSEIEDGILTAYEAMNLHLDNTDLVVLSACETGLGKVENGEGVYGLQRAFKVAGAKSIVMSLWKVNDKITQELMIDFYRNWSKLRNKYKAFKKAQLRIKQKYKHPYFWGAFIMTGTN